MKKIKYVALIGILIILSDIMIIAQENDYGSLSSINDQINWLNNNLGIQVSGTGFNYDQSSNTLTLSSGTSATIARDFSGTITLNGGTIELPNSAKFSGEGTYTQNGGFAITNGNLNGVEIANANGVTYNGNQISGTTNSLCSPDCVVGGQKFGINTKFIYNLGQNLLTAIGKLGITTFPNANIVFEDGNYKLGDMIVNLKDSEIYLAKGDRITIDGIELTAEKGPVKLSFIESKDGSKLIPIKKEMFQVPQNARSISDVFKEAGYQGSENFDKRKEIYESKYPNEKYTGTGPQNIKLLNALKNGDATLYYNDKVSNVQIRVPSQNLAPDSGLMMKTAEDFGKFAERYLSNNFEKLSENLDNSKISGTLESVREAAIRLTNEYNANPNAKSIVNPYTILSKIPIESSVVMGAINVGAGGVVSRGLLQVSEIAVNELNDQYKKEYGTTENKYNYNDVIRNPITNLRAGIEYYALMLNKCGGNEVCALSAYNIGEGKTINLFKSTGDIPVGAKPHVAKVLGFKERYVKK